ncbi:UDP-GLYCOSYLTRANSFERASE SUPERFAMILY PROTEIN [Salix purpurea]|uniref:starch synthase n=1 Tax=Salix purpurea TaxID=77065 RepID=A0A9Q0P2R1_SALPP|nr:UDP-GLYCOSYLTRANSFERASE SUPERFAMILY PROTEIN [Salix purpurea]
MRIVILSFPWRQNESFIFMGSKVTSVNGALEYLQKELKDENMRFVNKYEEALLHLIFAGSDIILCQSFHDPLTQVPLKAMKYGAAPVAVTSNENKFRHFVAHEQETTRFSQFISSAFGYLSLSQAVDEIKNNPSKWKQKIVDAMVKDFSWNAECYDIHVSAYTAMKTLLELEVLRLGYQGGSDHHLHSILTSPCPLIAVLLYSFNRICRAHCRPLPRLSRSQIALFRPFSHENLSFRVFSATFC